MKNKDNKKEDIQVRKWEYSPEPRLEGLLQASKYLKWKNLDKEE